MLRSILDPILNYENGEASGVDLARALKAIRPELDLYLLSDRNVEQVAGDPQADCIRRIFYRWKSRWKCTSRSSKASPRATTRPSSTTSRSMPTAHRHLPRPADRARQIGVQVRTGSATWASSTGSTCSSPRPSATTGGLDSLLEPTGNIKEAQEKAARAFGADHVFFVTNGTSTCNKMVVQALMRPGDIVIIDRNCHKSHHYGMVLAGGQPLYVEAFPLTQYSMYGAVPLRTIKQALLDLKAEGRLDRVRMLDLTNCTFDGHMYNTRRVMEECLAIKPDLIFLWDEAWFGFARFSPFLRRARRWAQPRAIEEWMRSPGRRGLRGAAEGLGEVPSDEVLLDTAPGSRPAQGRLRVYQTNSTHKSMSTHPPGLDGARARRRLLACREPVPRSRVHPRFDLAPTSSSSPVLDVARRQMELEGYGLVMNAIQIALTIRAEVNSHPLISKYFSVLGADEMIPAEFRKSGFVDFLTPGTNWGDMSRRCARTNSTSIPPA